MNSCRARMYFASFAIAIIGGGYTADAFASTRTICIAEHQRTSSTTIRHMSVPNGEGDGEIISRRDAIIQTFGKIVASSCVLVANGLEAGALDFDSFEKGQIENDVKECDPKMDRKCIPKLNDDEALCKYGGAGRARGAACRKVRDEGGKLPTGKPGERQVGGWFVPDTN